jgi:exopolyphosphatase / guanosine-5'-triphosphate,3'-diphosphate pyrophosphatase
MRVAAVDLGTNTTRLLVADVEDGRVEEVVRRSVVTGLGEGVDENRFLRPEAIARVFAVLGDFRREAGALGAERALAIATSAVRDAKNGASFLADVEGRFGFATRLVSGGEEAELTRRGIGALADTSLVLDVGGGSTELVMGSMSTSLDIGSVRLTERYLRSDPPTRAELSAAADHVRELLPDLEPEAAIGVAGTVWQLDALLGRITLPAVEAALERLALLPLAERREVPRLDPDRAPTIVAGALIVVETLRRYGLLEIAFSVRDLLDGIAFEAAAGSGITCEPKRSTI